MSMTANTSGGQSFHLPPLDGASGGSVARCLDTDSTQRTQYRQSVVVYCSTLQYTVQFTMYICTITKTYKVFTWLIHIGMTNSLVLVLKVGNMVRHHIGPKWMHPDRSSRLGLSANGWISQDQWFCTFSEQMLRSRYCTVHTLGLVLASTLPWGFIRWYKP